MKTKPYFAGLLNRFPLSVGARAHLAPAVERGIHAASSCDVVSRWKNPETVGTREVKRHECRAPFVQVVCHIILGISIVLINALPACAATTNDLAAMLRNGLFEEQVNHDMNAAIATYQSLVTQFDKDRLLTATAVFRLGECYRTLGKTNEAAAQYQRVVREFPDQTTLVTLSRQNLGALGSASQMSVASSGGVNTGSALSAAKAEAASLEAQIVRLKNMLHEDLRVLVQQNYPNPVLTKLVEQLTEARQNEQKLLVQFDESHPTMKSARELEKTISKQIDDQVLGVMKGLEMKLAMALDTVKNLSGASNNTDIKSGSDEEDQEIRRIQTMIQNSPDLINARGEGGMPLAKAAKNGWLKVATYLMDHGADVNRSWALSAAVSAGNRTMVELLLSRGADMSALDNSSGRTLLQSAVGNGYQSVAEVLLAHKADVNEEDYSGNTPMLVAAAAGQTKIVKMLLAAGANPDKENKDGRTPLSFAAERGPPESLKLLLDAKADPNRGKLDAPLFCAIQKQDAASAELLLQAGANPNLAGNIDLFVRSSSSSTPNPNVSRRTHFTPLGLAIYLKQPPMVQLLLKFKADPNDSQTDGKPLLFGALSNTNILGSLLDAGAKVDATAYSSRLNDLTVTPLGEATLQNIADAVEILLKNGANPNARFPDQNWTPLRCAAAILADRKVFELLLDNKADPNIQDNGGQTPLDFLNANLSNSSPQAKSKLGELADLLRAHGGLADLPKFDRIQVTRPETSYRSAAFYSGTNGWNQFTLLEVLAQQWGLLTTKRSGDWTTIESRTLFSGNPIRFPDLARVKIHRPGKDNGTKTTLTEDLTILDSRTGGMRDIPLQMGDVVEVPEADHPVNQTWGGLVQPDFLALSNSIARTVTLKVGGNSTNITLSTVINDFNLSIKNVISSSFMIRSVLDQSKLIRSSSDLTRVKVTRRESASTQPRVWVLDCSNPGKFPDLWLRNGDVIEVPEK